MTLTLTTTTRPATAADAEVIASIWHRGWPDGHLGHVPVALHARRRLADFQRLVAERIGATTVAVAGADVVGFVVVHDDEVEQLYVDEIARGTGVASMLLGQAESTFATRFDRAWLAVVAGNARARRFYERSGWTDAGERTDDAPVAGGGSFPVVVRRYEKDLREGATHG